jgi:hypothetical protein
VLATIGIAGTRRDQDSPRLWRVGSRAAPLLALPAEGGPRAGELLSGVVVRASERRDGFTHVVVEGWVKDGELEAITPPAAAPAPEAEPAKPATPPPPPEPVHDLALAHHVGVTASLERRGAESKLVVALELRSSRNEPVLVDGSHVSGRVTVFEQRRVPGGRVRGDELVARDVTFDGGRASLELALADLGASPPRLVLVQGRAEVDAKRTLFGAATDVVVTQN